ncbi:mechanosensitive ion channel [Oscillatoria sp. FACHB-1406]|uniref:mechanosensitive ion channel n=1 Tax=Oscillatoria sp. FACHB-1406 TaxID=2692846 RepID=UPI001688B177|nr:mechanosensitive ion channel [Oscillatoria sp. FACHB-1406]MBD2579100.1 mechanosensitive ion channel [Oscillatoria sp. FACHB-1406]
MIIIDAIAQIQIAPLLGQTDSTFTPDWLSSALGADIGTSVLNLIKAILILFFGWLIAIFASFVAQKLLERTTLDNKLAAWLTGSPTGTPDQEKPAVEKWFASIVFWLIFLFAVIAALQALNLNQVSAPLQSLLNQVTNFIPKLGGALLLLGVAWLIATLVKAIVTRVLRTARLDERLGQQTGTTPEANALTVTDTIANTLYWFVFLVFLPWILEALGLQTALAPVVGLLNEILLILPNIFAAFLIAAIGWLVAQVVRRVVTNFLAATGVDRVGAKFGVAGVTSRQSLSWILGTAVYILVLIPVAIAALQALRIDAISVPAISMLQQILDYLPRLFIVGLILALAFVVGQYLSEFVTSILTSFGFNNVFRWMGLPVSSSTVPLRDGELPGRSPTRTPSEIAGIIVLVGVMLVATLAAVDILQIPALTVLVGGLLVIAGQFLVGLLIFALGLYLANFTYNLIMSSGSRQSHILAQAARIAIIVFSGAMALQQIGIAPDIVKLAFGLLLGAVAVAIAISFGLGGRDAAGEQVREWLHSFKRKD